jgi:hypothetical protein
LHGRIAIFALGGLIKSELLMTDIPTFPMKSLFTLTEAYPLKMLNHRQEGHTQQREANGKKLEIISSTITKKSIVIQVRANL